MVSGFVILIEGDEQTAWFTRANHSDEADFSEVSISKDDDNSVSASFKSGKTTVSVLEKQHYRCGNFSL